MSRIIPAIDIIDGCCVRLSQGKYDSKKVYNESPLEVAKAFYDGGIKYLHVVDLDGAKQQHPVNLDIVKQIKNETGLIIDFGGGIKTKEAADILFDIGVDQITVGSLAVKNPDLVKSWIQVYGTEKIIIGVDTLDGTIATDGWEEKYERDIYSFINDYIEAGASYFLSTDIAKDGMLAGPNVELYKSIMAQCAGCKLIASGGVSGMEDVLELQEIAVDGIIIGKAIYENRISIDDLSTMV